MRVAVFGSAPGVRAPAQYDATIFANETPCLAKDLGVRVDETVLSSFIFHSGDPRDVAHLKSLRGLDLGHVVVLEGYVTAAEAQDRLMKNKSTFTRVDALRPAEWASTVQGVTGGPFGRQVVDGSSPWFSVSTGGYCVCRAFKDGAEVVICGMSMGPGYHHMAVPDTARGHLVGDASTLAALQARFPSRLSTTSKELSEIFGIRYE